MNLGSLKRLPTSVMMIGLLAGAISVSGCQPDPEPQSSDDSIKLEESVPMSAEPADPNDTVVAIEDPTLNQVQDDTIATVNTEVTQLTYLCAPELKVVATYQDADKQVVIDTDKGTVTLTKTNEGTNPEVFEVATAIDGSEGFTQWRVAHEARATGVMRAAGADASNVSTYECNKVD